jgi:hypothetical protein
MAKLVRYQQSGQTWYTTNLNPPSQQLLPSQNIRLFKPLIFLFPPTFYAFRISSSRRPESLAKSANDLQLIKW